MRFLFLIGLALALTACGPSRDTQRAFEAQCRQAGHKEGTQAFEDCLIVVEQQWRMAVVQMYYGSGAYQSTQSVGQNLFNLGTPNSRGIQRVAPARVPYYGSLPSQ